MSGPADSRQLFNTSAAARQGASRLPPPNRPRPSALDFSPASETPPPRPPQPPSRLPPPRPNAVASSSKSTFPSPIDSERTPPVPHPRPPKINPQPEAAPPLSAEKRVALAAGIITQIVHLNELINANSGSFTVGQDFESMEDDEYTQLLSTQLQAQAKDRSNAVRNATELLASDLLALLTEIPSSTLQKLHRAMEKLPNLQKTLDDFPNLDALTKELAGTRKAAEVDKEELQKALSQEKVRREELEGAISAERTERMESEGAFAEEMKRREANLQNALDEERSKRGELEIAFAVERTKRTELEGTFTEEMKKMESRFLALEARPEPLPPPPPQPALDLNKLEDLIKWLAGDMGNFAEFVGVDMIAIREKKRSREEAMGDGEEEPTMMAKLRKTEEAVERLKGLEDEPQKLEEVKSLVNTLVEDGAKAREDFEKIQDSLKAVECLPVKVQAVDERVTAVLEGELMAKTRELERKSDAMAASLKAFDVFPPKIEDCQNLLLKVSDGEEDRVKRESDFQAAINMRITTLDEQVVKLLKRPVGEVTMFALPLLTTAYSDTLQIPPPISSPLHPEQIRSFINAIDTRLQSVAAALHDEVRPEQFRLGTSLAAIQDRVEKSEPVLQNAVRSVDELVVHLDEVAIVMEFLHSALPFICREAQLSATARHQQLPRPNGAQPNGARAHVVPPQPSGAPRLNGAPRSNGAPPQPCRALNTPAHPNGTLAQPRGAPVQPNGAHAQANGIQGHPNGFQPQASGSRIIPAQAHASPAPIHRATPIQPSGVPPQRHSGPESRPNER
ncbi:hypothetical protein P7C70_g5777, partial [Phenoliferia sp. Uapishka_3]